MTSATRKDTPSKVPAISPAKQGGEAPARWAWVEASAWSPRMLAALEKGVKGGKWFSLIDKVYAPDNLEAAWGKTRRKHGRAGVDEQSVEMFAAHAERYLKELHEELRAGTYRPEAVLRRWIAKPGSTKQRPLGIPTVKDRIVQGALRHVLEPLFEVKFVPHSYGFRPRRGCKDALRRVAALLAQGYTWVVDADIQSYFDMIDHELLMADVNEVVADGRVLDLVRSYLNQQVLDEVRMWQPEKGSPQGAVISPLLANAFLHPVDLALQQKGYEMVRYADDLVLLCRSESEAREALAFLEVLVSARKLTLHPDKTRVVDATQPGGFDFLGYHFERGGRRPRDKSIKSLRDKIRPHTKRTAGVSLVVIVKKLNPILRGWFNYFKHGACQALSAMDVWVRMRLRSILRRRQHRKGRGGGYDYIRWPNAYFVSLGLFTMTTAWERARRSR